MDEDERRQYGQVLIDAIDKALGKGGSEDPPFPKRPARARDVPDADPGPPVVGMTDEQLIRQGAQLRGHGLL
jgi:hypothetical protein